MMRIPNRTYLRNVATIKLNPAKCTGCRMCLIVCPRDVFEMNGRIVAIAHRDQCMECGACMMNCPEEALYVKAGVGCAFGVINGLLKGTEPNCDCSGNDECC